MRQVNDHVKEALGIKPKQRFKKDYTKAIENFSEAIRLDPSFTQAYLNRATAKYDKNDFIIEIPYSRPSKKGRLILVLKKTERCCLMVFIGGLEPTRQRK